MRSLADILSELESDYGLLPLWDLYEWLDAKVERSGLGSLTRAGRTIFLVQRYDGGMAQGGFSTLMRWDRTLGIMPMVGALWEVGAQQTSRVLADLASLFPTGTIPDNVVLRCRAYDESVSPRVQEMDRLLEALQLAEREEDVCQLCLEHARNNVIELRTE